MASDAATDHVRARPAPTRRDDRRPDAAGGGHRLEEVVEVVAVSSRTAATVEEEVMDSCCDVKEDEDASQCHALIAEPCPSLGVVVADLTASPTDHHVVEETRV